MVYYWGFVLEYLVLRGLAGNYSLMAGEKKTKNEFRKFKRGSFKKVR